MLKVLVCIFAYNEGPKLERVINRFPAERNYDILVMDDGSTDSTQELLSTHPSILTLRNEKNMGIGYAMKRVFHYGIGQQYEVIIPFAGNDKDRPEDIPVLLEAINDGFEFVQGSRYAKGGNYGNMPFYRQIATRYLHPSLFSIISGMKISDSTNGFRAIHTKILKDSQIDYNQDWLNQYELEPYIFYKAIKTGFRVTEVPVTKIYPPKQLGKYTKMKPITGWWSILRPLIFLGLRIKA
jgi:dolichol-phosphate mannosyltransferase